MTICRQNGDVNFVGVPTGEKGVFVETVLPFPVPRPIPKTFSSELCTGPPRCATVTDFTARTSNACLAQAFVFWRRLVLQGTRRKKKARMRHHRQRGAACAFHKKALRACRPGGLSCGRRMLPHAVCDVASGLFSFGESPARPACAKKQTPAQGRRLTYGL